MRATPWEEVLWKMVGKIEKNTANFPQTPHCEFWSAPLYHANGYVTLSRTPSNQNDEHIAKMSLNNQKRKSSVTSINSSGVSATFIVDDDIDLHDQEVEATSNPTAISASRGSNLNQGSSNGKGDHDSDPCPANSDSQLGTASSSDYNDEMLKIRESAVQYSFISDRQLQSQPQTGDSARSGNANVDTTVFVTDESKDKLRKSQDFVLNCSRYAGYKSGKEDDEALKEHERRRPTKQAPADQPDAEEKEEEKDGTITEATRYAVALPTDLKQQMTISSIEETPSNSGNKVVAGVEVPVSPSHHPRVGAFAVEHGNRTAVRRGDRGVLPTYDSSNTMSTVNDDDQQAISGRKRSTIEIVAAEVAPDIVDLERCITERVTETVKKEQAENTPVAEVVDNSERNDDHDGLEMSIRQQQDTKTRKLIVGISSIFVLVVSALVSITIVLVNKAGGSGSPVAYKLPSNDTVLALVPEIICNERVPGAGWSQNCPREDTLQGGGVQTLVALSRLWNAPAAEISILNAGEIRNDILAGNFTVGNSHEILPFGSSGTLVLMDITGSRLMTAMERGIQKIFDDNLLDESSKSMGSYPYGAGIRFSVNMTAQSFSRLYDVEVNSTGSWQPINKTHVYQVVTTSYLANGGDSYHEFIDGHLDLEISPLAAFVQYCENAAILEDPRPEFFSTKDYIHDSRLILPGRDTA